MNQKIKEYIITGMGFGFPVTLLCMTLIGGMNGVIAEFLTWMVASALFGVISGFIFRTENDLNLPTALLLHCLSCMLVAVGAAWVCGYAKSLGALLRGVLPVFIVVYAVIYAVCYLSMKSDERRINRTLDGR